MVSAAPPGWERSKQQVIKVRDVTSDKYSGEGSAAGRWGGIVRSGRSGGIRQMQCGRVSVSKVTQIQLLVACMCVVWP